MGKGTTVFLFLILLSLPVGGIIAPQSVSAQTVRVLFPSHLTETYRVGDTHNTVKAVQILLNQTACPVTDSGAGSQTRESEHFGFLTEQAVRCFRHLTGQVANGTITPTFYATLLNAVKTGSVSRAAPQQREPREQSITPALPVATGSYTAEMESAVQRKQHIEKAKALIKEIRAKLQRRLKEIESRQPAAATEPTPVTVIEPATPSLIFPQGMPERIQYSKSKPMPTEEQKTADQTIKLIVPSVNTPKPTMSESPEDVVFIKLPSVYR